MQIPCLKMPVGHVMYRIEEPYLRDIQMKFLQGKELNETEKKLIDACISFAINNAQAAPVERCA